MCDNEEEKENERNDRLNMDNNYKYGNKLLLLWKTCV